MSFPPVPPPEPGGAFERMVQRRNVPPTFRRAPLYRAEWRTEAETVGGLDDLRAETLQTQAEMFVREVQTRTEPGMTWRLSFMEEEMGLPDGSLTGLDDDARRDRICARLHSWRLPTAHVIHDVAITYYADVQLYMDYVAYWCYIQFPSLPENLADMQAEIIRILPAHLGISFLVTMITWGYMYSWGGTWQGVYDANLTWDDLLNGGIGILPPP